jgi:ABC-type bacteriocin/lantibiotic exporter with double-glycine peptidase domain
MEIYGRWMSKYVIMQWIKLAEIMYKTLFLYLKKINIEFQARHIIDSVLP